MWPVLTLTSLSDSLFKSLFRVLFRYDIFISYARGDGKEYAVKLRDQLKQLDFSCFLDFDELPAGNSLNNALKRAIKKSATLVLVGTERAVKSRYVELEVGEFAGTGRAIIPIDIEGTLVETPWQVIKERDIVWIDEVKAALTKGVPSPNVADSIDKLFKYTRRNSRVRAQVLSTIVLFVVVIAAALFMIRQQVNAATLASAKAERETIEANKQKVLAANAIDESGKQKNAANAAERNAKFAEDKAKVAEDKATVAKKAASEATREAKRQEQIALTNADKAKRQQLIAEERTNYLRAKQIGVQADIDIDKGNDLERSVLLSVESLKTALTPDGYLAWTRGMALLPQADQVKFANDQDKVTAIAYSPDGNFFAEGTGDGGISFLRTDKMVEPVRRHLRSEQEIMVITFGKDWVAAASKHEFIMWDLDKFEEKRSSKTLTGFHGDAIAFSPDGRYVATGGPSRGGLLTVFDTTNSSLVIQKKIEHVGYIMSLAFTPDSKRLALGCHYKTYEEPKTTLNTAEIFDQSATRGKILFLEVANFEKGADIAAKPVASITEEGLIFKLTFGPTGEHLATVDINGVVRIWQVFDFDGEIKLKRSRGLTIKGHGLAGGNTQLGKATLVFSADESYIATAPDENTARVWEVSSGREVSRIMLQKPVEGIAFGSNGQFATSSGQVKFWKVEFGSAPSRLSFDKVSTEAELAGLAISPKGDRLAIAYKGSGVHVFSTIDWSQIAAPAQTDQVSNLTFNSDGRLLITASEDKVAILDTSNWSVTKTIQPAGRVEDETPSISFSPDDRWLIVTSGSVVELFENGSWREAHTMRHSDPVEEVFFSADGRRLAVRVDGRYRRESTHIFDVRKRIYLWDIDKQVLVGCKTDEDTYSEREPKTTQGPLVDCAELKGTQPEALFADVANWEKPREFNLISSKSPDGHWSVENKDQVELNFIEGSASRQVTALSRLNLWTFTQDSHWLVTAEGNLINLWPLTRDGLIAEACTRLRRRDLTVDEWKQYFSEEKHQATCPVKQ